MPFLPPNQQRQSTEGMKIEINIVYIVHVVQLFSVGKIFVNKTDY